jgi:hypothetical protein
LKKSPSVKPGLKVQGDQQLGAGVCERLNMSTSLRLRWDVAACGQRLLLFSQADQGAVKPQERARILLQPRYVSLADV